MLGGLRSHIGVRNGIFRNVPAEQLAAGVLQALRDRYPAVRDVEAFYAGNAVGTGGNIARLAALLGGMADTVPALTIDMQCASAAAAVEFGMLKIQCGLADVIVAGGFESSSMQPLKHYARHDPRYTPEGFKVSQFSPNTTSAKAMLEGAERTAHRYGVSRAELDAVAIASHAKAKAARDAGRLREVIVPLFGSTKDECIRDRMNEKLAARMPTIFTPEETAALLRDAGMPVPETVVPVLTAANACLTNDGASFVVLASERYCRAHNVRPALELCGACEVGVTPLMCPTGTLAAGEKILRQTGHSFEDIDFFEYNEAFAVITALFQREHGALQDRYCPWGGALAYGHPFGTSGATLLLHLWQELKQLGGHLGVVSIAGAGGTGAALLVARTEACE
jgi:acetyl-CoA C-acetyltransferase